MIMKNRKKVWLSYLLPYGMISRQGLKAVVRLNASAAVTFDENTTIQDRVLACEATGRYVLHAISMLEKDGYLEKLKRKYGPAHWKEIEVLRLTKKGLSLLTEAVLTDSNDKLDEYLYGSDRDYLLTPEVADYKLVMALNDLAERSGDSPENASLYQMALEDAIMDENVTIMATCLPDTKDATDALPKINGESLYRSLKLSEVHALFRRCNCLTYLDRRPMGNWQTWGINDSESFANYVNAKGLDIPAITYKALTTWYEQHPHSVYFQHPAELPELMEQPAFYGLHELPGFYADIDSSETASDNAQTGQKNFMRHTSLGVAIGKKTNYLCYHTHKIKTPWMPGVESATIASVQRIIDQYDPEKPVFGAGRKIENALMFCTTIAQFAKLFDRPGKFKSPFTTISIIPITNSGITQLSTLMQTSPTEYENIITKYLVELDVGFTKIEHPLYPLEYDNTPVFFGFNMELKKVHHALTDYQYGTKFLIACYADQVKYYQKIMPDVQFI